MSGLREFIGRLEEEGKLVRVKDEVSVRFEAAAIIKEFEREKAIYFEKIKESNFHVVAGLCGSRERLCMALNLASTDKLYEKILEALKNPTKPQIVSDGEVREVSNEALNHFKREAY